MRVIDAANPQDHSSIDRGRAVLAAEINNPQQTVMVIRGETPEISAFVDRASARCDPFPWRQGVWACKEYIIPPDKLASWFQGHADACAVILDLEDQPAKWLVPSARLIEIDIAWNRADGHQ